MVTCKNCGKEQDKKNKHCVNCGTKTSSEEKRAVIHSLPTQGFTLPENSFGKILFGSVLALLSVFVIPIFWICGYLLEIMINITKGDNSLPEWRFETQFFKGFIFIGISIVYFAIPLILITGSLLFSKSINLLGIALFLIASFLLPISLSSYAAGNGAFNSISSHLKSRFKQYIKVYFVLLITELTFNLTTNTLIHTYKSLIFLLIPLSSFFGFYILIVWARSYALIYKSDNCIKKQSRDI